MVDPTVIWVLVALYVVLSIPAILRLIARGAWLIVATVAVLSYVAIVAIRELLA